MWYKDYVKLRPLQKATFSIQPSEELKKLKRTRVDCRATSMLMAAIPSGAKEELISTKSLSPMKIVSKLMTPYQPGGTQEKTVILRQLEDPGEQPNPGAAAGKLRRWIRWRRRAEDISPKPA